MDGKLIFKLKKSCRQGCGPRAAELNPCYHESLRAAASFGSSLDKPGKHGRIFAARDFTQGSVWSMVFRPGSRPMRRRQSLRCSDEYESKSASPVSSFNAF